MADPGHRPWQSGLVTAFWDPIEIEIDAEQRFASAGICRISAENVSGFVFVKNAYPRGFLAREIASAKVVVGALGNFIFGEGNLIVVIEVIPVRGEPLEPPTHPLLKGRDLREGGSRNRYQRHITMLEMHEAGIEVISRQRTTGATLLPGRAEHEMIDY